MILVMKCLKYILCMVAFQNCINEQKTGLDHLVKMMKMCITLAKQDSLRCKLCDELIFTITFLYTFFYSCTPACTLLNFHKIWFEFDILGAYKLT